MSGEFGFDGVDLSQEGSGYSSCERCDVPLADHEKVRVYPEDGPPGSWHYEYECP